MTKPIAHPELKWIVTPDYIEQRDDGMIVLKKGSKSFFYNPPEGVTFDMIIHGLEVCRAEVYRLPMGRRSDD